VPVIKKNVEDLGFKFSDVKILIAGHAHPDHVGGDNAVKELTNAQVVVGTKDAEDTKKYTPAGKTHPIDRLVKEGDTVTLGGTTLTAHEMPGHTPGCLAWSTTLKENGKSYYTFIECSINAQALRSLTQYPGILDDFRATFKKARTFPVEVWVSSHASFYNLPAKYEKLKAMKPGDPNPFIDPQGFKDHIDDFEKRFETVVATPAPAPGQGKGGFGQGKGAPKQ
jgi:metallo-beta-lactamase class B